MKRWIALSLFAFSLNTTHAISQRNVKVSCNDTAINRQAQEIKNYYISQGFQVVRDVDLKMESRTPTPVIFNLAQGQLYQVVFVGSKASWKVQMDVLDAREQLIDQKYNLAHNEQPNYLLYMFSPDVSDEYLFMFTQNMKKDRNMCGELLLLRMGNSKQAASFKPYAP